MACTDKLIDFIPNVSLQVPIMQTNSVRFNTSSKTVQSNNTKDAELETVNTFDYNRQNNTGENQNVCNQRDQ